MSGLPLPPAMAAARAAGALSRLRGGGATSMPGIVLGKLRPDAISLLSSRLSAGSAVISATNGKTTTAAMVASILELGGARLVHNSAGANMAGGVTSSLLAASRYGGGIDGELGLFEVDEAWLAPVCEQLRPKAIALCNLFRDQLDRYGELEAIAERWEQTVHDGPGASAHLVLNADDPLVADLGREREAVLYFGVEDDGVALPGMAHAADAKRCRHCGAAYVFDAIYLGHLGRYHCPSCGRRRPQPTVLASEIELHGVSSASFTLTTPQGAARVELPLPGLYNVYNALAAAALASVLGMPPQHIAQALGASKAAFGRAEMVRVASREVRILLVKNPAGANEVLRTLALEPGEHDLLGILNDKIADGRDVSWIWDADFETLSGHLRSVICAGTRAAELALRLKYAGVEGERITITPSIEAALTQAAASKPADGQTQTLYALPTYTAMLELRALLVRRGEADGHWA
ncbi:MAG TPA: MurT ligase domain-containing protein [Solirubrobacteraceae bacterium]|nr:MurT ligase domain-containing protein [Solirubrobacteraceae bacterium]